MTRTGPPADSDRAARGRVFLALLCWLLAAALALTGIATLVPVLRLPSSTTSFALMIPDGGDGKRYEEPLRKRLSPFAKVAFDGAQQGLIVLRVQSRDMRLVRRLLTARSGEGIADTGLSRTEAARLRELCAADPLPATIEVVSEKEAPPVIDTRVPWRRGIGFLCLAGAAAVGAMVGTFSTWRKR